MKQKKKQARRTQKPAAKEQDFTSSDQEIQNGENLLDLLSDLDDEADPGPKVNIRFIWLNYFVMLLSIAAVISFLLHCFIVPFLLPIFATIFYSTVFAQNLHLISMGLTFFVSGTVAFFITEKIQSNVGNGFLQANEYPAHFDFYHTSEERVVHNPSLKKTKSMTHQYNHHHVTRPVKSDEMTLPYHPRPKPKPSIGR